MKNTDFRYHAHQLVDWMADYFEQVEALPVKPDCTPGEILNQLPDHAPLKPETFEKIFEDFKTLIMPGMTHWQSPKFFGYFPANNSYPSVLAEMLMSTLGAQCMSWQTSPAATELEQQVMVWLRDMLGLPADFSGVIQDTASTATLCAILTAREKATHANHQGLYQQKPMAIYASEEIHSSIDKAVRIAGLGDAFLRKIPVDEEYAMQTTALVETIQRDRANGIIPLCVVAAFGTTGSTAIDPIEKITSLCQRENIWCHIDAAFAGTALLLPEKRMLARGFEHADSFVFNPHKWMFTNFDCSAYFVKDHEALVKTFEILPEYLKTKEGDTVNNYRDWGIALGRRFRALKLWFVIRNFGIEGLQHLIRHHIQLAQQIQQWIEEDENFELLAPVPFNLVCFRYKPNDIEDEEKLNKFNQQLLEKLNASGQCFFSHTKLGGKFVIRWSVGQTQVQQHHIEKTWALIQRVKMAL